MVRCFFTKFTVFNNCPNPSSAKYSHCTGINTLSDAVNAFNVTNPKDGGQSINIKSKKTELRSTIISSNI